MAGRFAATRVDTPNLQVETEAARGLENGQVHAGEDVTDRAKYNGSLQKRIVDAKMRLHRKLLDEINLPAVEKASHAELKATLSELVSSYVLEERLPVNSSEFEALVDELIDEMTGLGPIEPLLKDPTIDDILINTHEFVYVERFGLLEQVPLVFKDEAHLLRIVNKVVSAVGRRVDETNPLCDARLADGSRVNVAVRPIAVDGPLVSIRKFSRGGFSLDRLVEVGSLRPAVANLLAAAVKCRLSMLVSGGTGSGKTTMLNALSQHISGKERLITIEDAAELQLQQTHVGRMETRPPNIEGNGEIRQRELVKNALRMRPDRIIVGEVRGEEAFDMLQAMNTGHEGSMTTIHANSTRDALSRLEQMVGMAGFPMSQTSIRSQIASAIRVVIQLQRLSDGKRRVTQVSEITGMEGDVTQTQNIYEFVRSGLDSEGNVLGELRATGIRPKFLEQLNLAGSDMPNDIFDPGKAL
ncbi:MAG: CpaF family protein [Hyphomicrobium sp.]